MPIIVFFLIIVADLDELSGYRETAYEGKTNDVGAKKQKEQKEQKRKQEEQKCKRKAKEIKRKAKEMLLQSQKQQKEEENRVRWTRFSGPKPHRRFIKRSKNNNNILYLFGNITCIV